MPSNEDGAGERDSLVPSMLDLVRLSRKRLFPPGGVELYRQIALLTEMSRGLEVLDVASGKGVPLEYFVKEFGVTGSGVDIDPAMVEEAEGHSRELGEGQRLQFQSGRSDRLPYRDAIFDIAIGEIGLANHCQPADAIRELVRVTKPGGFVVLVQLVWKAPVDAERRAVLSEHLGARPLMVVEWKRLLREAGVEDVHVEDWSDEETAFRPTVVKPFPDFAEMFSVGERIAILHRAWQRWGLKGVSAALARENEVHKLLTSERILGLDLLRGRKAGGEKKADGRGAVPASAGEVAARSTAGTVSSAADSTSAQRGAAASVDIGGQEPEGGRKSGPGGTSEEASTTAGLPLFGDEPLDTTEEATRGAAAPEPKDDDE